MYHINNTIILLTTSCLCAYPDNIYDIILLFKHFFQWFPFVGICVSSFVRFNFDNISIFSQMFGTIYFTKETLNKNFYVSSFFAIVIVSNGPINIFEQLWGSHDITFFIQEYTLSNHFETFFCAGFTWYVSHYLLIYNIIPRFVEGSIFLNLENSKIYY